MFATQVPTEAVADSTIYGKGNVLMERRDGGVGLVTLNRPKQLNALCYDLFEDLHSALSELDQDPIISAIVLTGSEKVAFMPVSAVGRKFARLGAWLPMEVMRIQEPVAHDA